MNWMVKVRNEAGVEAIEVFEEEPMQDLEGDILTLEGKDDDGNKSFYVNMGVVQQVVVYSMGGDEDDGE